MSKLRKIFAWINHHTEILLGVVKLAVSILAPALFLSNAWICEYLYPDPSSGWDVFIPMDLLAHNFWAINIMFYAIAGTIKTKYKVGDAFLYFGLFLSMFDVLDRMFFHIYTRILLDFIITIPCSIAFATLIYVRANRNREINP